MYIFSSNICYFKVFSWVVKIFLYGAMKFFGEILQKKKKRETKNLPPILHVYARHSQLIHKKYFIHSNVLKCFSECYGYTENACF